MYSWRHKSGYKIDLTPAQQQTRSNDTMSSAVHTDSASRQAYAGAGVLATV